MATGGTFGSSQIDASDALYDFSCAPCSDDGKNTEAVFQCTDCQIFYCQRCVTGHNKFTKNHKVVDKMSQLFGRGQRPLRSYSSSELPTDVCEEHQGEVIKMFCGNHDLVCCTVCIAVKHRSCQGVEYIPNVASRLLRDKGKDTAKRSLEKVKDDLQYLKSKIHVELKELSNQRDIIIEDIQKFKKRIIIRVEELEKESIKEVQDKHKDIADEITDSSNKISVMLKDVELHLDKLEHFKSNSQVQIFVDIKVAEKHVSDGNDCIKHSISRFGKTLIFDKDRRIETFLHDVQSIGDLIVGADVDGVDFGTIQSTSCKEKKDSKSSSGFGQIRQDGKDQPLKCQKCGKIFNKKYTLFVHQKRC